MVARERYARSCTVLVPHELPDMLPDMVEEGSIRGSSKIGARYKIFGANHSKQYAHGFISTNPCRAIRLAASAN